MQTNHPSLRDKVKNVWQELLAFWKTGAFWKNIGIMLALTIGLLLGISNWLSCYTHHGEKLKMASYVGMDLEKAEDASSDQSFHLIVTDSVFVLGKPGGIILEQNPRGGEIVKSNRNIYVTVTKYEPEKVPFTALPLLYGTEFVEMATICKARFDIDLVIGDYAFDAGPPGHILKVIYQNDTIAGPHIKRNELLIPKGTKLACIVSKDISDQVEIPELKCLKLSEAIVLIESSNLVLGNISRKGNFSTDTLCYVWDQSPDYVPGTLIQKGSVIQITLGLEKPDDCRRFEVVPENSDDEQH